MRDHLLGAATGGLTDGHRSSADETDDPAARPPCSPRHLPDEVRQIAAVPRTLSGKLLEVPVKRILMGTPIEQAVSRESLADPAALDLFVELAATASQP